MANKFQYPRGSEWKKWDLHVHTPASALAHTLGDNWDIYVEKLIDAINTHGISAIATADYFSIKGYRILQKYYDLTSKTISVNGKSAKVFIIPGVELRLNVFNSDRESINIHILFDPEHASPDFINQHFLEELKISFRGAEYPLKVQALLAIGKSISNGASLVIGEDFSGVSDPEKDNFMKKALAAITLVKRDINDALKDIDEVFASQKLFSKTYLICVVGKGHGGISSLKWFEDNKNTQFSRDGLIREDLTHHANIIFSNNKDDRDFYLGKRAGTSVEEVNTRFNNLKPCIWGSDSHDLTNLLHPSNGNTKDYTWIKSEITFEGLRQIIYEPELRVRVQEDNPSESETFACIDKLEINLPDSLKIQDNESKEETDFCLNHVYSISFSNNLNCIVGGRGSGKSTIVHVLYNSWAHREVQKLIELNSPLTNLKLTKDPLSKVRDLTAVSIPVSTEFFLQNEIEKFAKDINKMSTLVRNRLERLSLIDSASKSLKDIECECEKKREKFNDLIDAYDKIAEFDEKIRFINERISTLKKQTEVIKSEDYKKLQKEIETIATEISGFETYSREYKKVIEDLSEIEKGFKKYKWDKYAGQELIKKIITDIEDYKLKINEAYGQAKTVFDNKNYFTDLDSKKVQLRKYLQERGLSLENIGELADATEQITSLEGQVNVLKNEKIPFEDVYSSKGTILDEYKQTYDEYYKRFFTVSALLQNSLAGLKFDDHKTGITFVPRTNNNLLKNIVVDFIKKKNDSKMVLNSDNIESVIFDNETAVEELVADKQKIINVVQNSQKATTHTQVLRELFNNPVFLEQLHLRMCGQYFYINNIQVQTKLGEKLLQNTSFGERCGIVIAIVLVAGTNPIIIDQPEDNLDGKFISNVLVPLLRKQKQNRQIILVTRDANIVIGGDSELIQILEYKDIRTELLSADIENKVARPKYIWIVDGGEVAFQKREKKYSLS